MVFGASGGIGSAMVKLLASQGKFQSVYAISRKSGLAFENSDVIKPVKLPDYSETTLKQLSVQISQVDLDLVFIATGLLHNDHIQPEKRLSQINADALAELFNANSIVPILIAKHFSPLMPKNGLSVLAAVSARVGSIDDNRLGGWYSYRASKAALNMFFKTLAIELKRTNPNLIVSLLHPGTTDTNLSKPFQGNVPDEKLFDPEKTSRYLYNVICHLNKSDSGSFKDWDNKTIPW